MEELDLFRDPGCLVLWDYECYIKEDVIQRVEEFGSVRKSELSGFENTSESSPIGLKEVI